MTYTEIKPFEDKQVLMIFPDQEVATVKIAFVDAEYEDVIVELIATNMPEKWKRYSEDVSYVIPLSEIASVSAI